MLVSPNCKNNKGIKFHWNLHQSKKARWYVRFQSFLQGGQSKKIAFRRLKLTSSLLLIIMKIQWTRWTSLRQKQLLFIKLLCISNLKDTRFLNRMRHCLSPNNMLEKSWGSICSTVVEHTPAEQNSWGHGFDSRQVLGFFSSLSIPQ